MDSWKLYPRLGFPSQASSFFFCLGYKNTALGSCTSMSLYGELVPAGMWISSQCTSSSSAVTVCKREPFEPTQAPTLSPLQCSGTQFLSGYGTVYSPGYPRGSEPNHCEFLITEDEGYQAQLFLMDVQLDKNSALQLFSGLFDKTPFRKWVRAAFLSLIKNFSAWQIPTSPGKVCNHQPMSWRLSTILLEVKTVTMSGPWTISRWIPQPRLLLRQQRNSTPVEALSFTRERFVPYFLV